MGRAYSVIIYGDDPAAADAAAGLSELGFSVQAVGPERLSEALANGSADGVISFSPLPGHPGRGFIHLAVGEHNADTATARLQAPVHPIQLAARFRALARLDVLESTARLRMLDAHDAGAPAAPTATPSDDPTILFVGQPCPAFMRLQHAMTGAGVQTVAAFSTFNAFDYLHERAFDAVVLNADPDADLAHTVCSAMRRNTRLYHTPAILLTRGGSYADADEAFARGASDLLARDASDETIRARVTALADERRRRRIAKAQLEACRAPAFLDSHTDLFGAEFGRRHLQSLLQRASDHGQALSLVGLTADAPHDAGDQKGLAALDQFAAMLRHCVRAEDLAVRVGPGAFYLALPSTLTEDAEIIATRVAAIAECTAYEGSDPLKPFRLALNYRIIEPAAGMDPDAAIEQVLKPARAAALA